MSSNNTSDVEGSDSTKKVLWGPNSPAYANDPKYKKYTQQVEKCLNSFDNVHEWADFISFLKQLLKTLEAYKQFKEIPRKLIVAKRLSQCLNPALPTGVHQRALDVYTHIMEVLGSEGLQRDLALWSSGLFPFFEYAATSVKPTLLGLFDTHYLPLQGGLRPAMKAFILALLPGLEEETGEFFDKVLNLLDRLSGTVSPSFFLQNVWLIMLTSPSARGTSINYLSRRLPRLKADEDIASFVGRDIGLMIRAISAALEDDDSLVRRGALDILLQSLPLDNIAVKSAPAADREILMKAATSVVLRRDLALNRRLYSWVLGPDDNSQQQMTYLKTYALNLLTSTLKDEMLHPSAEYSPSRPFKIFISLLDKWEIGSLLTETLVFDAFKALRSSIKDGSDLGEDMVMTASTLYEAIEPHSLWKEFLNAVMADVLSEKGCSEGIVMVRHILVKYHTHDEEIETIHLPVVFAAILETLTFCLQHNPSRIPTASTLESFGLLQDIWKRIRIIHLKERPRLNVQDTGTPSDNGPYSFACTFYSNEKHSETLTTRKSSSMPLVTVFNDLITLSMSIAAALQDEQAESIATREAFIHALDIMAQLAQQLQLTSSEPLIISWNPAEWLSTVLGCIRSKTVNFSAVDIVVSTLVKLQRSTHLEPRFSMDNRQTISILTNSLLKYLRPCWASYHMRAVSLIWSLELSTSCPQVVPIMSQNLASRDATEVGVACEVFGVLWRLTDDALKPGFRLKVPMMIVLDTLRSEDPNLRRIGETWMRCSLKSYLRILDPLLFDLCDPSIRRSPSAVQIHVRQIRGLQYDRPIDQHYINHLLGILLAVVKFGGQGFSKTARGTLMSRCSHVGLLDRVGDAGGNVPETTYMDLIVNVLLLFLQSEPKPELMLSMSHPNTQLQSSTIDILQSLVARGDVDSTALRSAESIVVDKLYSCVHLGSLDLQNKLLHLLHSIISAFRARTEDTSNHGQQKLDDQKGTESTVNVNSLLVQTLVDGLSVSSNRPILQHWLDFILTTIPQFHEILQPAIGPLNDCVCRLLRSGLEEITLASSQSSTAGDIAVIATDADFLMLLNALERLVLLSLSQLPDTTQVDDDILSEKPTTEGTSILGYVSNVFSTEPTSGLTEEQISVKTLDYRSLHNAVHVLYSLWERMVTHPQQHLGSQEESITLIYSRSRARCRRVLEHLFRAYSLEVLESIIECWARGTVDTDSAAFELTDVLTSSAQNVVHMVCESISIRIPGMPERTRKHGICLTLSDTMLFDFLEQYLRRLEGPLAVQVWGRFLQLAKDLSSVFREFKSQAFSALRCFVVLADKMSQTSAIEDRRVRKELQDVFSKLVELCLLAGRSYDQGSWMRRHALAVNGTGRDSPILRDTKLDDKVNSSSTSLPDAVKLPWSTDLVDQIYTYLAFDVVPNLRKFLVDSDKVLALCTSIVSTIIAPVVKGRPRPLDVDGAILSILREMTKLSAAMKAWRGPIVDILNDNRCFNSSAEGGKRWRVLVKMLFETDKTALTELLSRITTAPSANIFTNREYEMLLRSLNLRRLSYVLLTGEKNQFLTQLPTIQEKLVDTLRSVTAPIVQSEVYLCVRVLLCRLSPHNLSSFWPVILTELYRAFEQVTGSLPSDGSEELGLILAASKLLDLLLVLQTEEFQIHQWIFITDTVDAVYRPDQWSPAAMLDRLAEIVGELPGEGSSKHLDHGVSTSPTTPSVGTRILRRPFLRNLHQLDSIRDLVPFFNQASIAYYESVYSSDGRVDWEAVEEGLYEDMFEGR